MYDKAASQKRFQEKLGGDKVSQDYLAEQAKINAEWQAQKDLERRFRSYLSEKLGLSDNAISFVIVNFDEIENFYGSKIQFSSPEKQSRFQRAVDFYRSEMAKI
jgi:hypothetical protein